MTPHIGSVALLLFFVVGMIVLVRAIQNTGRQFVPVTALWGLLVSGYLVTGGRFVHTMGSADWVDGLVGFVALCGALPVAQLIRQICPDCRRRLQLRDEVLLRPTRHRPGVGATTWSCHHCGHHHARTHTIPRLAETSSEAGPWQPTRPEGDCFGSAYAAGAGGGASWGEEREVMSTAKASSVDGV